ncbi:MAG: hypothetical protein U0X73_10105 [Thermoanaerobaculia bacterium]
MRLHLPRHLRSRPRLRPLPLWLRIAVGVVGWLCILLGIAGLFLPILQGFLFLILGFALISLTSQRVHLWLRGLMHRWPRAWRKLLKLRRSIHARLHPAAPREDDAPPGGA